jgi:formate/nitrite transporter FocA (FNT family)
MLLLVTQEHVLRGIIFSTYGIFVGDSPYLTVAHRRETQKFVVMSLQLLLTMVEMMERSHIVANPVEHTTCTSDHQEILQAHQSTDKWNDVAVPIIIPRSTLHS